MRTASPSPAPAAAASPLVERRRLRLLDGAETTLHIARFSREEYCPRVVVLDPPSTVRSWCERSGAAHAIVGGFYLRPGGPALGDLWIDGEALPSRPGRASSTPTSPMAVTRGPLSGSQRAS